MIDEIEAAGLRGRGGSGFPTAEKWRAARGAAADRKIVVANLMGADPSALGDRALAEGNPHLVVEGLLIAAYAVGASEAIVAVRRDWTDAIERLRHAVTEATEAHLAGYLVLGTDTSVQLSVWEGSGAYVAGEETALLNALAGDRGMPAIRPPYPADERPVGRADGGAERRDPGPRGLDRRPLAGGVRLGRQRGQPRHEARDGHGPRHGAGTARGPARHAAARPLGMAGGGTGSTKAVFVGGPGGGAIDVGQLTLAYDYEPLEQAGALIGSGSVLVTDTATCMVDTARFFVDFSAREACGKAVPCRIGTKRLVEALDRILAATPRPNDFILLRELSRKMSDTALCKLERMAPNPILTTLERFPDEYRAHAERGECLAGACRTDRGRRRCSSRCPASTPAAARVGTDELRHDERHAARQRQRDRHGDGKVTDYTPIWPMVPGTREISVTINGQQVQAEEGQTILQACRVLGIEIPTLCYEPKLAPYGACRICAVEVEGSDDTPISCGTDIDRRDGHHHPLRPGHREPAHGPRAHLQRPRRVLPAAVPVQVPDPRRHPRLPEAEHPRQLGGGDAHPEALAAVPGHPRPRLPRTVRDALPARGGRHRHRHPRLASVLRRSRPRGRRPGADPVAEGARQPDGASRSSARARPG